MSGALSLNNSYILRKKEKDGFLYYGGGTNEHSPYITDSLLFPKEIARELCQSTRFKGFETVSLCRAMIGVKIREDLIPY